MAYPGKSAGDPRPYQSTRRRSKEVYEATAYDGTIYRRNKVSGTSNFDYVDMVYRFHSQANAQAILTHYAANNYQSFSGSVWEDGVGETVTCWYAGEPQVSMPQGYGTWDVSVSLKVVRSS